ncbi:hypothetical protein [Aeromonas intestinalis]
MSQSMPFSDKKLSTNKGKRFYVIEFLVSLMTVKKMGQAGSLRLIPVTL